MTTVNQQLIIRFGQWLAGEPGAYQPDALKLILAAQNQSGIIGARIEGAVKNSSYELQQNIRQSMADAFTEGEINQILSVDRNGPYDWQ